MTQRRRESLEVEMGNDADERFARLVEQIAKQLQAGEALDVEALAREHPEFAERFRELLPTMQVLVDLGLSPSADAVPSVPSGEPVEGILGDYRIVRQIARGGMGVVYEAEQRSLGRRVALKVLPFAAVLDQRQLQRFRNESRAAAGLHHPNIVPVFAVGCERGVHYYAMQYIEGQTLAALIDGMESGQDTAPPLADGRAASAETAAMAGPTRETSFRRWSRFHEVARLGIQVANALQYAHSVGVVHRDIKPSNLLVDEAGKVWVTDFGLAQVESDAGLTMTGDVLGTLRYMSPEQALGQPVGIDHRTDIYSLGASLYELLTLQPVWSERNRESLLRQVTTEEPIPPRQLNPAIPRDLETIVLKAIARECNERYGSAQALSDDLQRFLEQKPILARRPTPFERVVKWSRRHRGIVAWATVLLLVTTIGSVAAAFLVAHEQGHTELALDTVKTRSIELVQQRQRAEHLLARSQLERGMARCNGGDPLGLLDLLEARQTADGLNDVTGAVSRLWAIAYEPWAHRLRLVVPEADALAFSPDGTLVASASGETAQLWDLRTARRQGQPMRLQRGIGVVAFSPNGKLLVTHSVEGVAQLWDTDTAKPIGPALRHVMGTAEFPGMAQWAAAFSPDGRLLATAAVDGTTRLWRTDSGQPHREPIRHDGEVWEVAFSLDGRYLATGSKDGTARVWDVADGQPIGVPIPHSQTVSCGRVTFSPDGELVATLLNVCETETGRRRHGMVQTGAEALAFSPDGTLFATAGRDWTIRLWDVATGGPLGHPLRHDGRVRAVAFSPDGMLLAAASMDERVQLWDVASGERYGAALPLLGPVSRVLFSSDGQHVAGCSFDGTGCVWKTHPDVPGRDLSFDAGVNAVCFRPDGGGLAVGCEDGNLWVCDLQAEPVLNNPLHHDGAVEAVAFRPDGGLLATATRQGTAIQLWDASSGDLINQQRHTGEYQVTSLDFSPDGELLAEGSDRWDVRLWHVRSRQVARTLRCHEQVHGLAFSRDGTFLATALRDGTVKFWDVASGARRGRPLRHHGPVWDVVYGNDHKLVATLSGDPGDVSLRLWDVSLGPPYHSLVLPRQTGQTTIAFSPSGKTMAIGSSQGTVRLWQLPQPPTGLREMQRKTWATLGICLDADGEPENVPWRQWRNLLGAAVSRSQK